MRLLTMASSSPANNPAKSGNRRRDFEEEFHIHRSLAKTRLQDSLDGNELARWKKLVNNRNSQKWMRKPLELFPSPRYEIEALKTIHSRSFECNVLLEIRDVRLPASSHHSSFTRLAKHRLHLICYTHADLIDKSTRDRVEEWTQKSWKEARTLFVDSREHQSNVGQSYGLIYDSLLRHLDERGGLNTTLTVGVANVGKSSFLISLLRYAREHGHIPKQIQSSPVVGGTKKKKKKTRRKLQRKGAPAIEDKPGKTRTLEEYLVRETPKAFVLDVPGITHPRFFFEERPEAWFGMACANLLPLSKDIIDDATSQSLICEYALHALNRDHHFEYVYKLQLKDEKGRLSPSNDIDHVLTHVGGSKITDPEKRRLKQCQTFLTLLNTGNFGPVILDDLSQPYSPFRFQPHHFEKNDSEDGINYDDTMDVRDIYDDTSIYDNEDS